MCGLLDAGLAGSFGERVAEALFGEGLAACADAGTHYCDLTGEPQWMRRMIDLHHERAKQTGARIVHTCGFDSIPSDIGTFAAQQEFRSRFGRYASQVTALSMAVQMPR